MYIKGQDLITIHIPLTPSNRIRAEKALIKAYKTRVFNQTDAELEMKAKNGINIDEKGQIHIGASIVKVYRKAKNILIQDWVKGRLENMPLLDLPIMVACHWAGNYYYWAYFNTDGEYIYTCYGEPPKQAYDLCV